MTREIMPLVIAAMNVRDTPPGHRKLIYEAELAREAKKYFRLFWESEEQFDNGEHWLGVDPELVALASKAVRQEVADAPRCIVCNSPISLPRQLACIALDHF